ELGVDYYPRRLPTAEERRELAGKAGDDDPDPVGDRVWESADSAWGFFRPWPSEKARHRMQSWPDRGRSAVCWFTTRLNFLNNLVRFDQRWKMFAPDVGKWDYFVRARLRFADGAEEVVRNEAYPEDLTGYDSLRFFTEKPALQLQT